MSDLEPLQARLGWTFQNPALLAEALSHRSAFVEGRTARHNERLEWLGDAVLQLAVTQCLHDRLAQADEGELSTVRANIVKNRDSLARVAGDLEIGPLIQLGRGERRDGGHAKPSVLADAFEALLGAMYLDGGLDPCLALVERLFGPAISALDPAKLEAQKHPKSQLQELAVERGLGPVRYVERGREGPDHQLVFRFEVRVGDSLVAEGTGGSKRDATTAAARAALLSLSEGP